ncbi:MarR family winged helix-turn-helix transcriptional regulator [Flaviflexus huanghaiensis]|uniref:MarR family winged helix-turn-helix transcriptional regulator n=1 Tax=Flaviflexus huanghaiensis TaxID=1111473 RepID=UPI0015F9C663|nr:MarR family transcriptional regulator [Flaviflexus huanghaiensis]
MTTDSNRAELIREILSGVTALAKVLSTEQRRPFEGKVLSRSQLLALFLLARVPAGLTPGRLAELLDVTPGAVTQLIDGLRAEGHVETQVSRTDARSRIVVLSGSAHQEVERFETAVVARLQTRFAGLTDGELASLAHMMNRITTEDR